MDLIDFSEFCSLFVTENLQVPRELYEKDKSGELDLYSETKTYLQKLFKSHLNNEVIFNEIRLEISTNNVNVNDLYDFLSKGK